MSKDFRGAADGRFSHIRQVAPMCPPIRRHWRHLANTIKLVLPSAHLSPQPKWQIDRFSRFCTAHGRKSLYFTMGTPFPQNCPFPWGIWTPSNLWFLGPSEPTTQTASRSVQPFLHVECPILYNGTPLLSWKYVPSHSGSGPQLMGPSWFPGRNHPSPQPKRHLDRFSRFCRVH